MQIVCQFVSGFIFFTQPINQLKPDHGFLVTNFANRNQDIAFLTVLVIVSHHKQTPADSAWKQT